MIAPAAISTGWPGSAQALGLAMLAVGLALGLGAPGLAQTIRIPDFRNEASTEKLCADCGVVRSVREITSKRPVNLPAGMEQPPGSMDGPASEPNRVGAVFVHSFGGGSSETFAGGVGTPEMQARFRETSYEITVRMADGSYRRIERPDGGRFRVGDRVRFSQGAIELI